MWGHMRTEGLWLKCEGCRQIIWKKDLEDNQSVCPKCGAHSRIDAVARLSTWRRRVQLRNAEGRLLGEVVDDEVSILDGRRVAVAIAFATDAGGARLDSLVAANEGAAGSGIEINRK